jgi:hypothetical protein
MRILIVLIAFVAGLHVSHRAEAGNKSRPLLIVAEDVEGEGIAARTKVRKLRGIGRSRSRFRRRTKLRRSNAIRRRVRRSSRRSYGRTKFKAQRKATNAMGVFILIMP